MASSAYTSNEIYAKELEDELMKYTRRDEQNKAEVSLLEKSQKVEKTTEEFSIYNDTEVNIIECTKSVRYEPTAVKYEGTTESSSSFDDSDSGEENNATIADSEALSAFHDDTSATQNISSFHEKFSIRKKKVTEHWRSYTQSISWRCKWLELQIKKLDSQAEVYEKELEAYKKRRTVTEDIELVDGVKSVAFSQINNKNDILKRKKRKKVEETTDIADYMSQHKLFAYYENKKFPVDGTFKRSDSKNPGKGTQIVDVNIEFGLEDELLSVRYGDPDNTAEHLLCKIFSMQSHVTKLKSTIDKVMSQNAGIFACLDNFSFSMPSSSSPNNEDGKEHTDTDEFLLPENSISSHGDTNHDVADAHFVGLSKRGNVVVKEEPDDSKSNDGVASSQAEELEKPRSSQQPPRVRSTARLTAPSSIKRKRGRRKAAGKMNRKFSG